MSYHIYQTEGFIIESIDLGESNKLITVFTRDLGLVRASAQGVRNLRSKLRYSLQELSYSAISLVRGKEIWRVTNARKLISLYDKRLPLQLRVMLLHILHFVKRLMPEEGKNEELFSFLSDLSSFIFSERSFFFTEDKQVKEDYIQGVLLHGKLYILQLLGYGTDKTALKDIIQVSPNNKQEYIHVIKAILPLQHQVTKEIERALSESQL